MPQGDQFKIYQVIRIAFSIFLCNTWPVLEMCRLYDAKVSFVNLPFLQEMRFQDSKQSQNTEKNLKFSSFTLSGLQQSSLAPSLQTDTNSQNICYWATAKIFLVIDYCFYICTFGSVTENRNWMVKVDKTCYVLRESGLDFV